MTLIRRSPFLATPLFISLIAIPVIAIVIDLTSQQFFGNYLYAQVNFTSSNLPILVIDTRGQNIPDEPKLDAEMGIIDNGAGQRNNINDPFNGYDGAIGIEMRGNASQMFPKKPYLFETRDALGNNLNVSLLGMPKENDWILRAAYIDRTLMRDALGFAMARRTGRWASRTRHVELVLNGDYRGVYILEESIKPDKNRLNIVRMDSADVAGDDLTGGYVYDIAQSENEFGKRRNLKYPKSDEVQPEQIAYIRKYDDDFRRVMEQSYYADPERGYPAWIDADYFIDEILIQEATKNSDAYGWSAHFHKDRLGKLRAGPAWDFDQAMSNSTFNDGPNYSEWIIEKSEHDDWLLQNYPPFWIKLFREPVFKKQLALRWFALRENAWKTNNVLALVDSMATHLNEAQARNFTRWPDVLGTFLWRETPGWEERDTYIEEVDYLKDFMVNRLAWMDAQLRRFTEDPPQPQNGLVMYYDCDDMNGAVLRDKSGMLNDGLFQGNPQWTNGKFGGGISFDGLDDYIDCGNPDNLDITNQITLSAWVKQRDAGNGEHNPWITKGDHAFALKHYSGNEYEFFIYHNGWQTVHAPVQDSDNNVWHHFAGTYDGQRLVIYIDGQAVASQPFAGSIDQTDFPINIGRNSEASDRFWNGVIDEIRIYNIALTDQQISAIFNDTVFVDDDKPANTNDYILAQNYPNPFNGKTIIRYSLPEEQLVTLTIYDLAGRRVSTLVKAFQPRGSHSVVFTADGLPSGLYVCELATASGVQQARKMLLLN